MAKATTDGQRVVIDTEFREQDYIKQVPGAKYKPQERIWAAPLSWATCVTLRGVFGDKLVVDEPLAQWAWNEVQTRIDPSMAMRDRLDFTTAENPQFLPFLANEDRLYPFQRAATAFLTIAERALLASEMGLGKTVQAISWLATLQKVKTSPLPALIICTNTMKKTWKREFEAWAPELEVVVVTGSKAQRDKQIGQARAPEEGEREADVIVINWEAIRNHSRLAPYGSIRLSDNEKLPKELNTIEWGAIITDEAHKMKNPAAKQTRAAWAIAHQQECYRLAMTGTPVTNTPDDLWSIMHFLDPAEWPTRTRYIDRFCLTSWNAFGGLEIVGVRPDTREEFYKILDPRFKRDLKKAVLTQLPDKIYQERFVDMSPKQRKAYKDIVEYMLTELDNGDTVFVTNPLAKLTRLSQFACAYAALDEDGEVRLSEPSCKVDALVELIEERNGAPLVVFAESRQLIELCEARLTKNKVDFVSIRGGVDELQREEGVRRFQTGEVPVLLATLGAGGEGITLTAADTLVFLQRSWSMVKNKQAEDRIHRIGQESDKVEIIDIVAEGTIESDKTVRLAEKEDRLQEVVRDRETILRLLGGE